MRLKTDQHGAVLARLQPTFPPLLPLHFNGPAHHQEILQVPPCPHVVKKRAWIQIAP